MLVQPALTTRPKDVATVLALILLLVAAIQWPNLFTLGALVYVAWRCWSWGLRTIR